MTTKTEKRTLVSRLRNDRAGNFGMLAAIVLPLVLAGGGMAIDLTRVVMARWRSNSVAQVRWSVRE